MVAFTFIEEKMAKTVYVSLDENNIVTGISESPLDGFVEKIDYNGSGHFDVGYWCDDEHQNFVPPKPFPSWTYDPQTALYHPPSPYPAKSDSQLSYHWDEEQLTWVVNEV